MRRRQNENVLPDLQTAEENHGRYTEDREVVDRRTEEEDDQIETKSEGEDGSLQLQEMISLINKI